MNYTCPVCYYDKLDEPAKDYNICDCCGTEFGNDDEFRTSSQLREEWIRNGAKWFFQEAPSGWDPWKQLNRYGVA